MLIHFIYAKIFRRKYYKGRTFFVSFVGEGGRVADAWCYVGGGFDSKKAFYDWIEERREYNNKLYGVNHVVTNCKIL
jgi:hypothetical protein